MPNLLFGRSEARREYDERRGHGHHHHKHRHHHSRSSERGQNENHAVSPSASAIEEKEAKQEAVVELLEQREEELGKDFDNMDVTEQVQEVEQFEAEHPELSNEQKELLEEAVLPDPDPDSPGHVECSSNLYNAKTQSLVVKV